MEKKDIYKFWDKINEAMVIIEEAGFIASSSEEVISHLKEYGTYEETYEPVFWVIDYLEKMLKD